MSLAAYIPVGSHIASSKTVIFILFIRICAELRVVLLKQATELNVSFTKIIELNKLVLSLRLYIVRIWCGIVQKTIQQMFL